LILIFSHIASEAASELVTQFPADAAFLITASAFHETVKAEISVNDFLSTCLSINGQKINIKQITGVVTTIPFFLRQEFYYIDPADRDYICSEMNSLFIYFLSTLSCKKINPPSLRSLTGTGLHKIEILKAAQKLNIPVWPYEMKNGSIAGRRPSDDLEHIRCTLVGNEFTREELPEAIRRYMKQLSSHYSMPYLSGNFYTENQSDYFLSDLVSVPDIIPMENRIAIIKHFLNPN
jgi:hypothetical protein